VFLRNWKAKESRHCKKERYRFVSHRKPGKREFPLGKLALGVEEGSEY